MAGNKRAFKTHEEEVSKKITTIISKVFSMGLHSKGQQVVRTNTLLWGKEEIGKLIAQEVGIAVDEQIDAMQTQDIPHSID